MGLRSSESLSDDQDPSFSSSSALQYYYETNLEIGEADRIVLNSSSAFSPNSTDNLNTTVEYIGVDNDSVFTFMYAVSIGGYIVNATLFFTICCRQKFRRATNYLLANLCVSSILFLISVNLRLSERTHGPMWAYTELNCVLWSILRRIPQALASLTIVAISCDRSQAARILFTRPCSSDMTKKILRIWIIAILTTIPRGFFYRYSPDLETPVMVYKCAPVAVGPYGLMNILYAIFHLISVFLLPMVILICHIYSTVQKIIFLKSRHQCQCQLEQHDSHHYHHHHHHQHHEGQGQNTQLHKKQLQLLRNSIVFAALFLSCWLPWGVYQQLGDLPKSILSPEFRHLVWIHFRTVRYLPFTVTAFLPFILVVCTYDANVFGSWSKCCGGGGDGEEASGENHGAQQRLEIQVNRARPIRLLVNHVQQHRHIPEEDVGRGDHHQPQGENEV